MKKFLKTAIVACIAVCLIACAGIFATACTDNSKYEITVVSATDEKPVQGVRVQFCAIGGTCLPMTTDKDGKVTVDLTQEMYKDHHNFDIAILPSGDTKYEIIKEDGFNYDKDGRILIDTETDGYSITFKVKVVD